MVGGSCGKTRKSTSRHSHSSKAKSSKVVTSSNSNNTIPTKLLSSVYDKESSVICVNAVPVECPSHFSVEELPLQAKGKICFQYLY